MKVKSLILLAIIFFQLCCFSQTRTLSSFTDTALKNNPQLLEYRNLLLSNRIDSQLIVAANRYQVTANSTSYYAPIINGYGYDVAITNGQQLAALVAVNRQIYNKRNLSLQFNSLQLQRDSLNVSSSITIQDIKKTIISQYILTYGDQLQIEFNNEVIELLSEEDSILKILTQQNVYKQVDYLSFLVTLQQQKLTRSQLVVQYKSDYATLNYLAGVVDTTIAPLAAPNLQLVTNYLEDSSPFLLKYKIDSLRLINEKNLIAIGYRPKVSLFADAGYQSSLVIAPHKNFGTSVGINLSIPIYDGHQKQLQFSKINIEERTRQRRKEYFTTQYRQENLQLEQQLKALEGLTEPINKQLEYLRTLIEVNGKLLETGDIRITDYVLALNNYISSRSMIVQNIISRFQIINQLNYWNTNLNQ